MIIVGLFFEILLETIAKQRLAQRWIPVSERLPDDEAEVLVSRRGMPVTLAWFYQKKKEWRLANVPFFEPPHIVAWTPTPASADVAEETI